ncbi:MAG: DUF4382 domain-containing protein [Gammaproteobacteria bacterium]
MSASKKCYPLAALCLLSVFTLTGCNSSSSGNATLNLAVTDTPVDGATSVVVTFTGVQLQGAGGAAMEYDFAMPKQIDLLKQQGSNSASLLTGVSIPAGNYQWIRLLVDMSQSTITTSDGNMHQLTIPSGDQTGLKLVSGFTLAAGDIANFTIDFNLRQSITLANGIYILKPALRLMNNQQVGTLSGSVSNTFTLGSVAISDPSCSPAVYIYSGSAVTPTDINTTSSVQPVATASASLNSSSGNYTYTQAFLAPGAYTLAMVCAADDDPSVTDTLTFSATKAATVTANQTTMVDFP